MQTLQKIMALFSLSHLEFAVLIRGRSPFTYTFMRFFKNFSTFLKEFYLNVFYFGAEILYQTFFISYLTGNNLYGGIIFFNNHQFIFRYTAILRVTHLLCFRKIYPELEPLHFPLKGLGYFLMDNTATSSHPLNFS